jgi:serine/threonine protein kinase
MSTAERFGDYLLLRKLTTDPLGETYRAGKTGAQGIERVVFLRLFNGAGVDREALARALADRAGVHRVLENPHIGEGAEVGRIGDTPYVAYEYISGKSLAELLAETRNRNFPLPVEHALFVTERMTFGLTAAYATRHREQRIQHGFLVPDLVLLSNEGEVRVLGFEAGPALRQSLGAGPVREAYGRYLAPEAAPGR